MTVAIEMTDLGKRYGKQWALRDCTLDLPAGSIAALVGPNGAGKTTLIQLAVGLTAPTAGTIRVFGDAPRPGTPASLARIGYVDRKSTRLNSSHDNISYAVFCLKKKRQCPSHL